MTANGDGVTGDLANVGDGSDRCLLTLECICRYAADVGDVGLLS